MVNPIIPSGDIFSKRQKKLRGECPDVYVYHDFPRPLRQQICYILNDGFDNCLLYQHPRVEKKRDHYEEIVNILHREFGVNTLANYPTHMKGFDNQGELENFVLTSAEIEETIDAVEVSFRYLHHNIKHVYKDNINFEPIEQELNCRFKEHGVGYQFTDGKPIRIDSELIHHDIVKPALKLLGQSHYEGAEEEFLKAHEHYRKGNAKEALDTCLKAFESVMKVICDKRGWRYKSRATATPLIQVCFDNGLIQQHWESQYSALRSLLESSVPTGRNRLSGHGQGANPTIVPNHIVAYMLHMTASAIVFLAEAERSLP